MPVSVDNYTGQFSESSIGIQSRKDWLVMTEFSTMPFYPAKNQHEELIF